MNIYEDEDPEAPLDLREFLRRNKQLIIAAVAGVLFYGFISVASRPFDSAIAAEKAESSAAHKNPWAK